LFKDMKVNDLSDINKISLLVLSKLILFIFILSSVVNMDYYKLCLINNKIKCNTCLYLLNTFS
ncbi:hypothetical protein, partial [Clostridium fallax]